MTDRPVAIAGTGQTAFGPSEADVRHLGAEAARLAIEDSPFAPGDVNTAYVGNVGGPAEPQSGVVGQYCLRELGLTGVSITNVENACSSSACALRLAYRAVTAGFEDVVLVIGVENMTGPTTETATEGLGGSADVLRESERGFTFPSKYAMVARDYAALHGDGNVDGDGNVAGGVPLREAMTRVSVKNHRNGALNPKAHFQREIEPVDVETSPLVADPIHLYDMCPISDGGAAVVVAAPGAIDAAGGTDRPPVTIEASVHRTGEYDEPGRLAKAVCARETTRTAYRRSGIDATDLDVVELHDAATIGEIVRTEAIGICEWGKGARFVLDGETALDGSTPVNPSGGLKARGHPIGATGLAQIAEITWQLRGEAGDRQVSNAQTGLALNTGGSFNGVSANYAVTVLQRSS